MESRDDFVRLDDARKEAVAYGDRLQAAIFTVVPRECRLRPEPCMSKSMINLLTPEMFEWHIFGLRLVTREDVCRLCYMTSCPWNSGVSWRGIRKFKIQLLAALFVFLREGRSKRLLRVASVKDDSAKHVL